MIPVWLVYLLNVLVFGGLMSGVGWSHTHTHTQSLS